MEEFNTIDKVRNLFESIDALGETNLFFVAYQDTRKVNGMVAGMEYPYDGLLINASEKGIAMFYLHASFMSKLFALKLSKMTLDREGYLVIPASDIRGIKIKNYAPMNSKTKAVEINTIDGKSHKLAVNMNEVDFPYHNDGFAQFIEKYGA